MKDSIQKYGWLVVTVIIIAILIGLAVPAANYMRDNTVGIVGGLGDKLQNGLNPGDSSKDPTPEINYVNFTITSSNRDKIGYTGVEGENLIIPETFEDTDGTWYKVVGVGGQAFSNCANLASVTIPTTVTSMGYRAFLNCTNLKTVYYEGTIEEWCKISFSSDSNPCYNGAALYIDGALVQNLVIPDTITEINQDTFRGCTSLKTAKISNNTTKIGDYAFYNCANLNSVTLPNSITTIGRSTFSESARLTSITIPDSVTDIGGNAFWNCYNLSTVYYNGTLEQWCNFNFSSPSANPCYNNATLYIGGQSVQTVKIPDTITEIKDYAFYGCINVKSIEISENVTSIGNYAFRNCTALTNITVTTTEPPVLNSTAFSNCNSLAVITVPAGCADAYKAATNWSSYADKIIEAS